MVLHGYFSYGNYCLASREACHVCVSHSSRSGVKLCNVDRIACSAEQKGLAVFCLLDSWNCTCLFTFVKFISLAPSLHPLYHCVCVVKMLPYINGQWADTITIRDKI